MKKFITLFLCVAVTVLGIPLHIASATSSGKLIASDLCVKDANQNIIKDLREGFPGESCSVEGVVTNSSAADETVTVMVASYDGTRLTNVQKQSFNIPAGTDTSISMPFQWHTATCAGQESVSVLVFNKDLGPVCDSFTIGYTDSASMYVTSNLVYSEDFEDGIPEEWLNSTTGYKTCEIYEESDGNKMLLMNAASTIIQTPRFLTGSTNVAVTADFCQGGSTGSSISALGFGRYDLGGDTSQRFMYYDVVTPTAKTRDVFGYAVAESGILADTYTYDAFSNETGLLNQTTRETEPFTMTMGYYNGSIFCHAEDEEKSTLWNYSTEIETDEFLFEEMIHQTDGFAITSHSATTYVDNLKAYAVVKSNELVLDLPEQVYINEWYELDVKAIGEDGNEYSLPLENITFKYDNTSAEIADGKIKLLKTGEQTVRAICNDRATGGKGWATLNVNGVSEIDEIKIVNLADGYKSGDEITFDVVAFNNGEEVETNAYVVTCDNIGVEGTTISGLSAGNHTVSVSCDGVSDQKSIYISKYSDAALSKTSGFMVGGEYEYTLIGTTSTSTEVITDYTASYDKSALSISDGKIKILKPGTHDIEYSFDKVSKVITIDTMPEQGITIVDNFEDTATKTQYFNYDIKDVVTDGSNKVLALKNKTTDLTLAYGLSNYTLSGKFKIESGSVDTDAYNAGFEVVTRRVANDMFGTTSRGVHFMYNADGNGKADMRIGTSLGQENISESGQWHDFSVTMYGKVCVFNVDGYEMVTKVSTTMTAGFYIIANNCRVMLDDVSVTRTPTSSEQIVAKVYRSTLNPYERYLMTDIAALKKGESNVFVSPDNVSWKVLDDSVMEITDGVLSFNDAIEDGEYSLTAVYQGTEYPITVTVKKPDVSKVEYTINTVEKRQMDSAIRRSEKCDTYGVNFSKNELTYLPGVYAKMLMYPKLADYTDALIWHVNEAQYQDTIVGRGNDGGDFVMLQLIMAYNELYGKLNASDEAWDYVKNYLTSVSYATDADKHSENHALVHFAAALLTSEAWPGSNVSGDTAANTHETYKKYLIDWYNKRINRGLGEYNSAHYYYVDVFALEILYTYTNDAEIKQVCYDMLNYIYADGLDNNINDNFGGAELRAYAYKDLTTRFAGFKIMFNLGNYVIDDTYEYANLQMSNAYNCAYRPVELLFKQALDTERRYENLETSETYHLPHTVNWDSFVTRYTHVTPDYVLGSRINYTAPTSLGELSDLNCHQEMPWSVQFGSKSSRLILGGLQSRNEETSRTYWMSSGGQNTFKLMQDKNMLVGIYELTDESTFVHYRIPKNEFETVDEESGWIFIDDTDAYLAFKPVASSYAWSTSTAVSGQIALSDSEIKVTDKYSGFVLQVVDKTEYSGTYEQFKEDILENANIAFTFGDEECTLSYTGINGTDSVGVDYHNNIRYKNGNVYTPDITKLHSSPYLNSVIDSGEVTLTYGDDSYVIRPVQE